MKKDHTIVIGAGEVGTALWSVLDEVYIVTVIDLGHIPGMPEPMDETEVMHICFPYAEDFISEVQRYQRKYEPEVTVIHSTVPLGTSLDCDAVHSPVIGIHPNLRESLLTFTKFIGGLSGPASIAAEHMRRAGMKVCITDKPETTEWLKVLSTTYYGLLISWARHVKDLAVANELPFEAYTLWQKSYNAGYRALGYEDAFTRPEGIVPIQKPGDDRAFGGHCIDSNMRFLSEDDPFVNLIMSYDIGTKATK